MKKILITGANSYVGISVEKWLLKEPEKYYVETIDMKNPIWREFDFSQFDVVFHVAAIVHVKEKNKNLYYEINRDLAYEVAQKSKVSGVKHFIFMSTMGVYGNNSGVINNVTRTNPKNPYSKSKLEAESWISSLKNDSFKVSILRPPLVYGYLCKGNYRALSKFAIKTPVFPKVKNKRSMIFIDFLSKYIQLIIDKGIDGILLPQNLAYVNTSYLVYQISSIHDKKIILTRILNFVKLLKFINIFAKIFSDNYYSYDMYTKSELDIIKEANFMSFENTILKSEGLS